MALRILVDDDHEPTRHAITSILATRPNWHVCGEASTGGPATWMEDIPPEINRRGFIKETHFTIAYSPVPDESVSQFNGEMKIESGSTGTRILVSTPLSKSTAAENELKVESFPSSAWIPWSGLFQCLSNR